MENQDSDEPNIHKDYKDQLNSLLLGQCQYERHYLYQRRNIILCINNMTSIKKIQYKNNAR